MMNLAHSLSETQIFGHLSQEQIHQLVARAIQRSYTSGTWLACQGEIWPYLFLVGQGSVVAVKESLEGRSLILETIGAGEVFWGLAFFLDETPMPAGLKASQESEILLWSRKDLSEALLEDGRLSWELSKMVLRRALRASEIVDDLAFQPVAGRLARFMLQRFGSQHQERISRDLTLDDMASHIGSTREMVCRILQRFSNQGLIEITRTEFVFLDKDGLGRLAQKSLE